MRIFRDTVCKQHEYQNMAPKNNPRGVSTLEKQKLLQPRPHSGPTSYPGNLVPRACDPWEGNEGSGIIRFREESDWPLK